MDLRAALNAMDDDYQYDDEPPVPIQTETVDVYLLRPEEPREIELKDFTIMKPKNNKMHRLVRFYPRCQISYRATLPAEEKTVVSPGGTVTTTLLPERLPRHNGGFSNPSRHAEIFRLKRDLLKEYFDSIQDDDREAAMFDALIGRSAHPAAQPPSWANNPSYEYNDREEGRTFTPAPPRKRLPLPKYKPVKVGNEDFIPLTGDKPGSLTLDERVKYISSLWPGLAPVDDDDDIMDYYGIEVQIISEDEREKDLAEDESKRKDSDTSATTAPIMESELPRKIAETKVEEDAASNSDTTAPSSPEMTVETRSTALLKLKEAAADEDDDEIKPNPIATKQDDWVQCDKCQKWRRLPNQVNVSELPASWYCKMNKWDKRHNKCTAPEEKLVVLMKGTDLVEYRQRKFAQDFIQRCKRLDKLSHHYKYTHSHDDNGERKFVQCVECLKLRPLIGGMDPNKVAEPFACWMNWDELLASCSAPEGLLHPRVKSEPRQNVSSYSSVAVGDDSTKGKKGTTDLGGNKTGRKGKRKATAEKGATKKMKRRAAA
ncbi:MORC family CW-type zinc finger protein 4 [Phytophthora citrophthora]|uniref:MORC family CW-type zinc finger protein 4 n=1 Tax=Phytophthora citrophthora TaxID=4793 RepID=A0AAD9GUW3_9STRA|nr:MORC family CW-type zinc finger protein 4 [Phytophthora citrophthora]